MITPSSYFDDKPLVFEIIAENAFDKFNEFALSQDEKNWFVTWTDCRLRWLHANKDEWKKKLDKQNNKTRDAVITFVEHWAKSFIFDPEKFKQIHPIQGD